MTEHAIEAVLRNKRILWLEDRPETIALQLRAVLEAGADVVQLETPRAGLAELLNEKQSFDLVILDVLLPDAELPRQLAELKVELDISDGSAQNGLALALWLRRHRSRTPFFFYTVIPGVKDDRLGTASDLDSDNLLFVHRGDKRYWGPGFVALVQEVLGRTSWAR